MARSHRKQSETTPKPKGDSAGLRRIGLVFVGVVLCACIGLARGGRGIAPPPTRPVAQLVAEPTKAPAAARDSASPPTATAALAAEATTLPTLEATEEPTATVATEAPVEPTVKPTEAPAATEVPTEAPTAEPPTAEPPTAEPPPPPPPSDPALITPVITFKGEQGTVDPPYWPCREGQIKGNRNSGKYHVPTGQFYNKTYQDVECFDSREAAEAAGYVASQR